MIRTRLLTTLQVHIGAVHEVGPVPDGFRRVIEITGGTMAGPVLSGEVLPGGADWNTTRPDGSAAVWARYTLRTDDGVCLGIVNAGTVQGEGLAAHAVTAIRMEAPEGAYAWLNDAVLVGTLSPLPDRPGVEIGIHEASPAPATPAPGTASGHEPAR